MPHGFVSESKARIYLLKHNQLTTKHISCMRGFYFGDPRSQKQKKPREISRGFCNGHRFRGFD